MALTQAAVNAWRQSVDRQDTILETGLGLLNAQTAKKEIPNFTGEIKNELAIEEWFKIAKRNSYKCRMEQRTKTSFLSRTNGQVSIKF
jgi:hypothetical protein